MISSEDWKRNTIGWCPIHAGGILDLVGAKDDERSGEKARRKGKIMAKGKRSEARERQRTAPTKLRANEAITARGLGLGQWGGGVVGQLPKVPPRDAKFKQKSTDSTPGGRKLNWPLKFWDALIKLEIRTA